MLIKSFVFHSQQLALFYGVTVLIEFIVHYFLGFKLLKHMQLLLLMNLITVLCAYVLSQPLNSFTDLVILEFAVIVFEGFFIFKTFGKVTFKKALIASFLANLFSSVIGAYLLTMLFL